MCLEPSLRPEPSHTPEPVSTSTTLLDGHESRFPDRSVASPNWVRRTDVVKALCRGRKYSRKPINLGVLSALLSNPANPRLGLPRMVQFANAYACSMARKCIRCKPHDSLCGSRLEKRRARDTESTVCAESLEMSVFGERINHLSQATPTHIERAGVA